jgi:hypothetical protein
MSYNGDIAILRGADNATIQRLPRQIEMGVRAPV